MTSETDSLDREQLYEEVWATSLRQLSRKYGMSDRGLAKLCARMEVPVPGVGHWAKVAAGQTIERPPILPHSSETKFDKEKEIFHPLILQTVKAFSCISQDGRFETPVEPNLNIRVSKDAFNRALVLMNRVIKSLVDKGGSVSVLKCEPVYPDRSLFKTMVSLEDESVDIYLTETNNYASGMSEAAPKLLLGSSDETRAKKTWRDLKYKRLETMTEVASDGIINLIQEKRKNKLAEEARIAEYKAWKEEDLAYQKLIREQRSELANLEIQAECWQRADVIRKYLASIELAFSEGRLKPANLKLFTSWLKAGNKMADKLDPLTGEWEQIAPEISRKSEHLIAFFGHQKTHKRWTCIK